MTKRPQPVEPPPSIDSIRAATLAEHTYVQRRELQVIEAHGEVIERRVLFSYTCECGSFTEYLIKDLADQALVHHLSGAILRAFHGTEFFGQPGTKRL